MINNFKMVVAYDGSAFAGWQKQGNTDNTIQGKLESTLSRMVGYPVEINGAGRTDAGVHASGQVANFKLDRFLRQDNSLFEKVLINSEMDYILNYLNKFLPERIAVLSVEKVDARFHSQLNAKSKIYTYRIWTSPVHPVFDRDYVYIWGKSLNVDSMKAVAEKYIGTHDFLDMSSLNHSKKSTERTIYSIDFVELPNELQITFHGDGFLYNMIRIMVAKMLSEATDFNLKMAPAQGLILKEVLY